MLQAHTGFKEFYKEIHQYNLKYYTSQGYSHSSQTGYPDTTTRQTKMKKFQACTLTSMQESCINIPDHMAAGETHNFAAGHQPTA